MKVKKGRSLTNHCHKKKNQNNMAWGKLIYFQFKQNWMVIIKDENQNTLLPHQPFFPGSTSCLHSFRLKCHRGMRKGGCGQPITAPFQHSSQVFSFSSMDPSITWSSLGLNYSSMESSTQATFLSGHYLLLLCGLFHVLWGNHCSDARSSSSLSFFTDSGACRAVSCFFPPCSSVCLAFFSAF